ncbi:hypothetical protein R6Z07F_000564 [Ovis aries]
MPGVLEGVARSGSRVVLLGVGLRHRPSPGFAKSQASAACLRGHLRPRTRPFCAGSPQRPSAERQFLTRSAAKLLKAFQSLPTFEIRPVHVVPCSRSPRGKGDEKTRRPGTPKLPAGFLEQNPILSPPLPSASTAALRHAPILQPGSPEARRALPFWWDVSCNHLTRDPERKHRGKEKIKKVLPWQPQAFTGQLVGWEGRPLPACRWYSPRLRVFLSNNNFQQLRPCIVGSDPGLLGDGKGTKTPPPLWLSDPGKEAKPRCGYTGQRYTDRCLLGRVGLQFVAPGAPGAIRAGTRVEGIAALAAFPPLSGASRAPSGYVGSPAHTPAGKAAPGRRRPGQEAGARRRRGAREPE